MTDRIKEIKNIIKGLKAFEQYLMDILMNDGGDEEFKNTIQRVIGMEILMEKQLKDAKAQARAAQGGKG